MPIYAYKCGSCGHAKDVLQKISDDPLTQCPSCGQVDLRWRAEGRAPRKSDRNKPSANTHYSLAA